MNSAGNRIWLCLLGIILCAGAVARAQDELQVPVALHLSSRLSDGNYTIAQIARAARAQGIGALLLSERDLMRWEYGLWPLRTLIRRRVETASILRLGPERYLEECARNESEQLLIIPGTESAPFYHWEGNPLTGLKLIGWHRHILCLGLRRPNDYRDLPVIGNARAIPARTGRQSVLLVSPALLIALGLILMRRRRFSYTDAAGKEWGPPSRLWTAAGRIIAALGILWTAHNFPFREPLFDQYRAETGERAYENYIRYANDRGGLTFWVHPEIRNSERFTGVLVETMPYIEELSALDGYTGLSLFPDSYDAIGRPGRAWDRLNLDFVAGKRGAPVWGVGGIALDTGELDAALRYVSTVVLAERYTHAGLLQALARGKAYLVRGKDASRARLESFSVIDTAHPAEQAQAGEQLSLSGAAALQISVSVKEPLSPELTLRVIRSGRVIVEEPIRCPFSGIVRDPEALTQERGFYRLEIESADTLIVSNPVFYRIQGTRRLAPETGETTRPRS